MKTTATIGLLIALAIGLSFFSCDTADTDTSFDPVKPGKMRLAFDNVVGASDLKLGTGSYQNSAGEAFTITRFNYFR